MQTEQIEAHEDFSLTELEKLATIDYYLAKVERCFTSDGTPISFTQCRSFVESHIQYLKAKEANTQKFDMMKPDECSAAMAMIVGMITRVVADDAPTKSETAI